MANDGYGVALDSKENAAREPKQALGGSRGMFPFFALMSDLKFGLYMALKK